jgi:hypothetical protein
MSSDVLPNKSEYVHPNLEYAFSIYVLCTVQYRYYALVNILLLPNQEQKLHCIKPQLFACILLYGAGIAQSIKHLAISWTAKIMVLSFYFFIIYIHNTEKKNFFLKKSIGS